MGNANLRGRVCSHSELPGTFLCGLTWGHFTPNALAELSTDRSRSAGAPAHSPVSTGAAQHPQSATSPLSTAHALLLLLFLLMARLTWIIFRLEDLGLETAKIF